MALVRASIFCVSFLVFAYSNADPVLVIEPSNMTVPMGGNVRFRCRVDSPLAVTVNWIRGNTVISNNREAYNNIDIGRYSVIGDTRNDFDLQIIDIKPYDEAPLKCQAIENEGSGSVVSRTAFLTVHYPPDDRLTCRLVTGSNRYKVGDSIEAYCILAGLGVPPADLQWVNMDGTNVTPAFKDIELNNILLKFNRSVSVDDDGSEFTCVIIHPLVTKPTECKVGPIKVFYAPFNTTITPVSPSAVNFTEGDDIEFSCSANFNHEQGATFTWYTKPTSRGHKITYADDERTIVRFSKVSIGLNGTTLICNVTNRDGFSIDSTIIYILQDGDTRTTPMEPTKSPQLNLPTSSPVNFPNTYIIVFILMGVIFVLLLGIVVILVIGRKWREPVIVLDINEEVCRRSLSGGGSLVFGSGSHSIVLQHHSHNGDRHLFEVHQGKKDGYSIASSASCCSHHSHLPESQDHEDHPSDPQKAAKIEGTEFYRSAHTSRHNSVDSACSGSSHYERSICSSLNGSRPGTPTRLSQDPLPPTPAESIPMATLGGNHLLKLEDEEHHAEKNYYMNSPKRKPEDRREGSRDHDTSSRRKSDEHNYEDVTPVTKRKLYSPEVDTGEDDFPDDDKPRITPEQQFGEVNEDLMK